MHNNLKELIIQSKDIYGEEAKQLIADELALKQFNGEKALCPFHEEVTPSFTWNADDNAFKCFGCGKRYGIIDHRQYYHKESFKTAVDWLFKMTNTRYKLEADTKDDYIYPNTESELTSKVIYDYLHTRGLSDETINSFDIKETLNGEISFEFYNEFDELLTVKYRKPRKLERGEAKMRCQSEVDNSPLLWNMNHVNFDSDLIITEGEFDAMAVYESGHKNVVSVPFGSHNSNWIEYNWDWLESFDNIILMADNDKAGDKMKEDVIPRLGEWRCKTIKYPSDKRCTDANAVLHIYGKDMLHELIDSAKDIPIKNIIDMADVEDVDLLNARGIKSGLVELDKRIAKFFMGTLAVWTGINSSGKSTLVNQICVAEPLNQGYKTFIYSGELSKYQLKNWIEYPLAGAEHVTEHITADDQPTFFTVSNSIKDQMKEWYRGKIFFYDNKVDSSAQSIIQRMTLVARKYGVKNFLLDNLMTIDLSQYKGRSIFEKQTEFLKELTATSIKLNIVIHLIAHPRKLDFIKRLTKLDVSGSGDITNLADYVLAVHRVTPQEREGVTNNRGEYTTEPIEYDAILDLFKNRPVGFQDIAVGLYFDRKSKRFYKTERELLKQYGWVKNDGVVVNDITTIGENENEENPF